MKILICSDGSTQADNALRFGGVIAAACQAETTLLGITENPGEANPILEALKRGQQMLTDKKIPVELISKAGHPIEEILKRTQETDYDLVIIGAIRKGTHGPFLMSSKAYKIIKAIKPPVLTVIGNRANLKRILICTGGKKEIEKAIALAGKIAQGTQATVCLFHIMPEPPVIYATLRKKEIDVEVVLNSNSELGRNLRAQKQSLEALGVTVEIILRHGIVQHEIFSEIERGQYDMVVTGSSSSSGAMQTYIMGDVTREIVNRADCPVLVVRGAEGIHGLVREAKRIFSKLTESFVAPVPLKN
ncbi:MAG: universal stress protein [Verrucomicrobiota bacterium]|nr:universal stress protein [Verrucomicrobiota bacterium]